MATLPTDVNDSPNYDSDAHASHHNTIHGLNNQLGNFTQSTSAPGSPATGDLWLDTDAVPSGSSVRGALANGYAQATSDQGSIGTTPADLTGLSVTVTVNSGERIRITGFVPTFYGASTDTTTQLYIMEGATQLNRAEVLVRSGSGNSHGIVLWIGTPSAGSHTYKLRAGTASGTVTMEGGATKPAFILVEGIGT